MKKIRVLGLIIGFAFAGSAFAGDITLTPAGCDTSAGGNCWTITNDPSNPSDAEINTLVGTTGLVTQYKADVGDEGDPATDESGGFADDYSTVFMNSALDPEDAWITWDGPDAIDCSAGCYLVVKDGRHQPNTYIFDISAWDGTGAIHLEDFWVGGGAISHVAILSGGGRQVPEPGTLALLGIGLFGMGMLRRRRP